MLHCCLYKSRSLVSPRSANCADIYLTARRLNTRVGITGYLHHEDGIFVQFIEGPPWSIKALLNNIERDSRHASLTILKSCEASERRFRGWDMAFTNEETRRFKTWRSGEALERSIAVASSQQLFEFMLYGSAEMQFPPETLVEQFA